MQLNHKPLIGWLYRPIFGPGQNSISVSPPFSLRFSHPDPIKTENALAACYLYFRFPTGLFKIIIFYLFTLFFTIIFIFYFVLLHFTFSFFGYARTGTWVHVATPLRGIHPYMAHIGMCRWTGYGFWPLCPKKST